ncbi:hypothetical protein Leryth_012857 [Lithospermum erythrorhizon]|nr:hypothetical protein Leryth_012857 [Lithospermum erythrorhizon]
MCNPNNKSTLTTITVIDHHKQSSPTQFYINLSSLTPTTTTIAASESIKTQSTQLSNFNYLPTISEFVQESKELIHLSFPIALTALILYARSILSMLFLGHLGDTELAAGSLAIAFANITGYSVLSGLALGMEPLCSQAFGAQRPKLLSLTLQRSIIFLLMKFGVAMQLLATSNVVVLVTLVLYIWFKGLHVPTWTKPSRECLTGWAPLIRLAGPSCVSVCLEWWWYEIMIVLCGLLVDPKATVASMGILIQTTAFLYVFPSSLSFAVSTRVGNELGANRPDKARVVSLVSIFIAGLMGLCAMCFATSMQDVWARMFTVDVDIIRLTSVALPIIGLCELGNCPQTVGCGVVRGTARPSTAANVNLGAFYLVGMPVAIGLGFYFGVGFSGLWIGLLAAQVCCAGLMLYVVGTTDWKYQAIKAQMLTCTESIDQKADVEMGDCEKEPLICVTVTSS